MINFECREANDTTSSAVNVQFEVFKIIKSSQGLLCSQLTHFKYFSLLSEERVRLRLKQKKLIFCL